MKYRALILVMAVSAMLALVPAIAASPVNWKENFDNDPLQGDPGSGGYSYFEKGWPYAAVTDNRTGPAGAKVYVANQTVVASLATTCITAFNVTNRSYDFFEFWFSPEGSTNNATIFELWDGIHRLVWCNISKTTVKFYNATNVKKVEQIIANNTWYLVRFDFNYTLDTVRISLWNTTRTTRLNGTWHVINSTSNEAGLDRVQIKNVAGAYAECYFDGFEFYDGASTTAAEGTLEALNTIIPALVLLALTGMTIRVLARLRL